MVADKQPVKEGDRPKWTKKNNLPDVTASWHNYMKREVVRDFQQTLLHCSEAPYDEDTIMSIPTEPYEFPSGYNNVSSFFVLLISHILNLGVIAGTLFPVVYHILLHSTHYTIVDTIARIV